MMTNSSEGDRKLIQRNSPFNTSFLSFVTLVVEGFAKVNREIEQTSFAI
jgi:hypothetical protein